MTKILGITRRVSAHLGMPKILAIVAEIRIRFMRLPWKFAFQILNLKAMMTPLKTGKLKMSDTAFNTTAYCYFIFYAE